MLTPTRRPTRSSLSLIHICIAVVRVSGPEAYAVVGEIFTPRNPAKQVAEAKGYTAMLGHYHLRGEEMDCLLYTSRCV